MGLVTDSNVFPAGTKRKIANRHRQDFRKSILKRISSPQKFDTQLFSQFVWDNYIKKLHLNSLSSNQQTAAWLVTIPLLPTIITITT